MGNMIGGNIEAASQAISNQKVDVDDPTIVELVDNAGNFLVDNEDNDLVTAA